MRQLHTTHITPIGVGVFIKWSKTGPDRRPGQTGPDRGLSVRSSVLFFSVFGLRSGPVLDRVDRLMDRTGPDLVFFLNNLPWPFFCLQSSLLWSSPVLVLALPSRSIPLPQSVNHLPLDSQSLIFFLSLSSLTLYSLPLHLAVFSCYCSPLNTVARILSALWSMRTLADVQRLPVRRFSWWSLEVCLDLGIVLIWVFDLRLLCI